MQVWANTLIQNEERYIWFAVMSVINYIDKIIIWDTGSDDRTVEIVKKIRNKYPDKVEFEEVGKVNVNDFPKMRQGMLEKTKSDWLIIVDGDEVWWDDSIKEIINVIDKEGKNLDSIVNRYYNIVGDIFHYQPENAGMYKIDNAEGHLNIRAINRGIPGLFAAKPHGQQGYFDSKGQLIQERDDKKRKHLFNPSYLHFTHMERSFTHDTDVPKRNIKYKFELGIKFPLDFYFPEVFFRPIPDIIPSPWNRMTNSYYLKAILQTPLRAMKRKYFKPLTSGY